MACTSDDDWHTQFPRAGDGISAASIILGILKENDILDFIYRGSSTRNGEPGYSGPV